MQYRICEQFKDDTIISLECKIMKLIIHFITWTSNKLKQHTMYKFRREKWTFHMYHQFNKMLLLTISFYLRLLAPLKVNVLAWPISGED